MRSIIITGLVLIVVVAGFLTTQPSVTSIPNIPRLGGIISQDNITGILRGVAVFPGSDFVVVGETTELVGTTTDVTLRPRDGLIIKYTSAGAYAWHRIIDFTERLSLTDVVIDGSSIYAVGMNNVARGFAVKLTDTGTIVWMSNYTVPNIDVVGFSGITVSASELVVSGGFFDEGEFDPALFRIDLNGGLLASYGFSSADAWVWYDIAAAESPYYFTGGESGVGCMQKVQTSAISWQHCDGSTSTQFDSVVNHDGNAVSAGYLQNATGRYAALLNRSSAGSLNWARTYNVGSAAFTGSATTSLADKLFLVGTNGTVIRANINQLDSYVVQLMDGGILTRFFANKYSADGSLDWAVEYGDLYNDVALATAVDSVPRLLVVGGQVGSTELIAHPLVVRYEKL